MESNKQVTLASGNYFAPGTYKSKFRQQFLHGGIANIITTTFLAPLQRWRIISQTQKAYPLRPKKFTNIFNYISRIPKQQGIFAFWRGNTTAIWIYIYQTLFTLGIYDNLKHYNQLINQQTKQVSLLTSFTDNILFPLYASIISTAIIHPLDTYRIQKTMLYHKSSKDAHFTKLRHRLSQLDSVKQIYQGYWLNNIISIINFNFYKHLYEDIKKINIQANTNNIISTQTLLSIFAVALVHPLDTFKKIYQLNNLNKPTIFAGYRGVINYIQQHKLHGIFYNGFITSLTKTALFVPIYWQVFKYWQEFISKNQLKFME